MTVDTGWIKTGKSFEKIADLLSVHVFKYSGLWSAVVRVSDSSAWGAHYISGICAVDTPEQAMSIADNYILLTALFPC